MYDVSPKELRKRNTRVYAMSCNEVYNYVGYHEKNSYVCHMYHSFIICKKRKMVHNEKEKNNRQGFLCLDFEVKYWWGGEYTCVLH